MFEDIPLPLDWPVYVSHEQAQAYARWKGKSLPTEAQFHRAAYDNGPGFARENVDFRSWDPEPVTASQPNRFGVSQLVGNGWESTATRFEPFIHNWWGTVGNGPLRASSRSPAFGLSPFI